MQRQNLKTIIDDFFRNGDTLHPYLPTLTQDTLPDNPFRRLRKTWSSDLLRKQLDLQKVLNITLKRMQK